MKRIISLWLVVVLFAVQPCYAAVCIGWPGASAPSGQDTDLALWWNVESVNHGADDYPESMTWTLASVATISTTAVKNGANGLYPVGSYDYASATFTSDNIAPSSGRYFMWIKVPTGYFGSGYVVMYKYVNSNIYWKLSITGSSSDFEIALDGKSNSIVWTQIVTTGADCAEGNWYFVELVIGNDKAQVIVNGTSRVDSPATRAVVSGSGDFMIGNNGGSAGRMYLDTVGASTNQNTDAYALYKDNTVSPR